MFVCLRQFKQDPATSRLWRFYALFAGLSLLLTLGVKINGEEGVYVNSALEMVHHGDYFTTTLWQDFYGRPPLINWLIIAVAYVIGFSHTIIASRIVTAVSTILTGAIIFRLVKRMSGKSDLAWLSVCCLFGEMLVFRLGWLAYADTALMVFLSLSFYGLYIGISEQRARYFVLASISLFLAFMTKALTPYVFYGLAGLALVWRHPHRRFFFTLKALLAHSLAVLLLALYFYCFSQNWQNMWHSLTAGKDNYNLLISWHGWLVYAWRVLLQYPGLLLMGMFPASLCVVYLWLKPAKTKINTSDAAFASHHAWMFFFCFIPAWFSWDQWVEMRYFLPVVPLLAVYMAVKIYYAPLYLRATFNKLLMAMVVVKLILGAVAFPLYYHIARPNYQAISHDILYLTGNKPLYVKPGASSVLSLTATLNQYTFPKQLVSLYHPHQQFQGFIITQMSKGDKPAKLSDAVWVKTYNSRYTHRAYALYRLQAK